VGTRFLPAGAVPVVFDCTHNIINYYVVSRYMYGVCTFYVLPQKEGDLVAQALPLEAAKLAVGAPRDLN
jgi:hypothetical protein